MHWEGRGRREREGARKRQKESERVRGWGGGGELGMVHSIRRGRRKYSLTPTSRPDVGDDTD
jgi:hypothetical protein